MTAVDQPGTVPSPETETPLHAAAWMVQDMGVAMPPIPHIYLEAIEEFDLGEIFGTQLSLADLKTRSALEDRLAGNVWPVQGLAFGFMPVGTGGIWFYTLVGEQSILHVSIRVSFYSQAASNSGKFNISAANRLLERYLSHEANYLRAINPMPPMAGALRRIVCYSNEAGFCRETAACWAGDGKALTFLPQNEVFALVVETLNKGGEEVMFRL